MDADVIRENIKNNVNKIKQIQNEINLKMNEIAHILNSIHNNAQSSKHFPYLKNLIAQTLEKRSQIDQLLNYVQICSNKLDDQTTMATMNHNKNHHHYRRLYYDRLELLKFRNQSFNSNLEKIPFEIRRHH
uniref:Uncharacterized protein LOC113793468 n=1 Tax=Dermatophagoides pteronyssinus TaxID=6956 RepID=A0A6P6Y1E7_DERPT|nr:uncharacterized protein LOC113793468 [Dermatophagoides pteronyssinus]